MNVEEMYRLQGYRLISYLDVDIYQYLRLEDGEHSHA